MTMQVAAQLPALLKRFASDELITLALVQIPQYFDLDVIHSSRLGSSFKDLLKVLSDLFFKQVQEQTLEQISKTLRYFASTEHALKAKAEAAVQAIAERLHVDYQTCFDEKLSDV